MYYNKSTIISIVGPQINPIVIITALLEYIVNGVYSIRAVQQSFVYFVDQ